MNSTTVIEIASLLDYKNGSIATLLHQLSFEGLKSKSTIPIPTFDSGIKVKLYELIARCGPKLLDIFSFATIYGDARVTHGFCVVIEGECANKSSKFASVKIDKIAERYEVETHCFMLDNEALTELLKSKTVLYDPTKEKYRIVVKSHPNGDYATTVETVATKVVAASTRSQSMPITPAPVAAKPLIKCVAKTPELLIKELMQNKLRSVPACYGIDDHGELNRIAEEIPSGKIHVSVYNPRGKSGHFYLCTPEAVKRRKDTAYCRGAECGNINCHKHTYEFISGRYFSSATDTRNYISSIAPLLLALGHLWNPEREKMTADDEDELIRLSLDYIDHGVIEETSDHSSSE